MAHNIWGGRFWNRDNKPAWHGLGINSEEPITAVQAIERIGEYEVKKLPLLAQGVPGHKFGRAESGYYQLWRMATSDDNEARPFGAPVSESYELIGPRETAEIWDAALQGKNGYTPIETLGVLREGREIFICAKVTKFDILGDEIEQYMVLHKPMYSDDAATIIQTCVRTVCANTLALGMSRATAKKVIIHKTGARDEMAKWLNEMWKQSNGINLEAKNIFESMASKKVHSQDATALIQRVYPDPAQPKPEWHNQFGLTFEEHLQRFEQKAAEVITVRDTIMGLFGGDSATLDTKATRDTAFGLYNAISEYEDNRRGPRAAAAVGSLIGERAATIRKAYNVVAEFCGHSFTTN